MAADLLCSCWDPAAAHAGLAGGLSGSQETTTRSQAVWNTKSVLTVIKKTRFVLIMCKEETTQRAEVLFVFDFFLVVF